MAAYRLTPLWGSDEFLPSQLLQSLGQSLALSGIMFTGVLNIRPQDALTFGAMIQISRLFGGELGLAFITTFERHREQRASNLIGLHLHAGGLDVEGRLSQYGHVLAHAGRATGAASSMLHSVVRTMATTEASIEGFVVVGASAAVGLVVLLVMLPSPPRTAASHVPLFTRRQAE
jgi:MFS transporter, DHA2 family, multidrug resistance protein